MSDVKPLARIFPHSAQGKFNNYQNEGAEDSLGRSIIMYFQSLLARRADESSTVKEWYQPTVNITPASYPRIFWLGHATFLIQINGKHILTDPVFGNLTFLYPRIVPVGIVLNNLPSIDYIILSHNHRDHMDASSLKGLKKKFPQVRLLVPQGDKAWFDRRGFQQVSEHMWWDRVELPGLVMTFLPAFHWSQRGLFDRNKSLWGSWMIESDGLSIYFAGDSAYADHFKRIAYYFPSIDSALMPIAPCEPRLWMRRSHIDADEAGQAFLDLKAHHFIPMHWGTFYFGVDGFISPIERLNTWWQRNEASLAQKKLTLLKIGQSVDIMSMRQPTSALEVEQSILSPTQIP